MGNAMMGSGEADGDNRSACYTSCQAALAKLTNGRFGLLLFYYRALRAADDALANPLLGDISIKVVAPCSV